MTDEDQHETAGTEGDAGSPLQSETTSNTVTANVVSTVVQAGVITGGVHNHLPAPRPPLPAPHQLLAAPAGFVGRVDQLAALDRALTTPEGSSSEDDGPGEGATAVISAIAGAGGIGKTWLALTWAHRNLDRFPDGQLFIDLQGFSPAGAPMEPALAVRGFLYALGVDPGRIPADLQARAGLYRSLVAGKRMLIVLDNAASIDQVVPLLPGSPTCTVIATSRHRLTSLATAYGVHLVELDVLPATDAQALLARHLGADRLAAEPEAVAELLAVCAGLPLAVRIVAARAEHHPNFPLSVLAEELRDVSARLSGLDAGDLRANVRTALSWSFHALGTQAASLFGLLGIAPGPDISLLAAASLVAQSPAQARAVLQELENASLLHQHAPRRYRMHDLIRLHAADTAPHHLPDDVREAALRRVVDFYLHTAHAADHLQSPHRPPILLDPPAAGVRPQPLLDSPAAVAWFDTEHPCVLAAQHTAATYHWYQTVRNLAFSLATYHYRVGHRHDQLAVWQAALAADDHLPESTRTVTHRYLGFTYSLLGRHNEAIEHLHQALDVAERHHDPTQQAYAYYTLARALERQGSNRRALEHATHCLNLSRTLNYPEGEPHALNQVGWLSARLGNYDTARAHCHAALAQFRRHCDPYGEASALHSLGYIDHHTGHYDHAIGGYQQALAQFRALGYTHEVADTLDRLGHSHAALGQPGQARIMWREALEMYRAQGRDDDTERVQRQLDEHDHLGGAADPDK